ncbi:MAG TPA: membrane protein insertase YidC [Actinomycetota bacterium]|nr:membrane protein insertase YidC [Actinomycetota bacterium]
MEKRALIAIALSVAVLLAWQAWFGASPQSPPPRGPGGPAAPEPISPAGGTGAPPGGTNVPTAVPRAPVPETAAAVTEIVTPLYRASLAADGSVTAWIIEYRGKKPLAVGGPLRPLAVAVQPAGGSPELVALHPEQGRVVVERGQPPARVRFTGATADGMRLERTLEIRPDSYRIGASVQVDAGNRVRGPFDLVVYWATPVTLPGGPASAPIVTVGEQRTTGQHLLGRILIDHPGRDPIVFEPPAPALRNGQPGSVGAPELKDPHLVPAAVVTGDGRWTALEDDYFIAALIPRSPAALTRGRASDVAQVGVVFQGVQVAPGQPWRGTGELYVGPKEWDRLRSLGVGLEAAQARNYGHFLWALFPMWWFCVPLLWVMNFFGTWLPGQNYGVAIILLTVLVKLAFYPLSLKSMRSMKQMQALQPQLNTLRSKYRSDPQRFQREQMELFRKHRVNPMGGCLPMVVQIPIFYALYLTLQYSVELQGAPFFLWITDLSKKDPYYVLPILMGISMLVQQRMTPTTADPRQAQIMLIMPVIFTFMFLEFPTGLVLYWLVNNVLSILQQYMIDRTARLAKA